MTRRLLTIFLAGVVAIALALPAAAGKNDGGAVHKPPYKKGWTGGDDWNHIETDPKTGHVQVLRAFPGISPVVGCAPEPAAGWATLTTPHEVTKRIKNVTLNFDAMLDPYAWVYATVWDNKKDALGVKKFQGPFSGSRKLTVDLFRQPRRGSTIIVEFGAQVGDACPMVSGADVTFSKITIK